MLRAWPLGARTLSPDTTREAQVFRQIGAGEILIILAVLMFLFGAKRLPELARSLGKSARELRRGMQEGHEGSGPTEEAAPILSDSNPNGETR